MNTVSTAKTWNYSRPPGGVVQCLVQALESAPCLLTQRGDELDHFLPAHAEYVPKQISAMARQ